MLNTRHLIRELRRSGSSAAHSWLNPRVSKRNSVIARAQRCFDRPKVKFVVAGICEGGVLLSLVSLGVAA